MFSGQLVQMRFDVGVPQRGPQNLDAAPVRKQLVRTPPEDGCWVSNHCRPFQVVAPTWFFTSQIPHLGFTLAACVHTASARSV